ncbi:Alpha-hemolysin translocation ATP-binding protein HlyB [Maioricimonas rarisocia]|uniref:Alpha-hemolysin translocation ATP-binding protein HlyB n=1 Tax=Maioricimonas rarisocia TaxID=2528026 RepID=A0A517Z504_9PLAN|nr:ABC transporter ATP-binding protein [Maioricimonas rarisocia]QDU37555.1 Alpha-hemolysin translocation ATP-binding protein HlyB [Maioricimonas rarisocia]
MINAVHGSRNDADTAAQLLEELVSRAGRPVERAHIHRVLNDAAAMWPADSEVSWWRCLVEAIRSLELKGRIVDCTFAQMKEVVREGASVIARRSDGSGWIGIAAWRRSRFEILRPDADSERAWLKPSALRPMLGASSRDSVIRCVVIESGTPVAGHHPGAEVARTPYERLMTLLRPESSDLWIITIFALVTGILALATPMAVETLVNTVAFGRLLQPIVVLALMLFAFLAFSAALRALQTYVVEIIQRRLFARVAADLAYRLPRIESEALDGKSGRELVNRFFEIATIQKVCAQLLLDGVSLVLGTVIGMAVLAFYHPWLLGFDVVLLALIAFVIFVLGRGAVDSSIRESKMKYVMAAWLEDVVSCPTAFRHGGASEFALERTDRMTYAYLTARKAHFRVLMRQIIFALGLQAAASTILLGLGGWLVISGQLTLGQLVASELIVTVIVGSFAKLGKHMENYYDLLASVDKLGVLFDLPTERPDGLMSLPTDGPADVQMNNVSYASKSAGGRLDDLTLDLESGSRLMVTAEDEAVPSLLLDLLFGARTPSHGYIAINGIDPRDMRPESLRRNVALARKIEVFGGTVSQNVHLERPDVSAPDVREALEQVGLIDDILDLPEGLDTELIEGGHPLSELQARRLMLARAIAGKPSLLLVDRLLDVFPDAEAERLTRLLIDPDQPWTLIMVTLRDQLLELGTTRCDLDSPHAPDILEVARVE